MIRILNKFNDSQPIKNKPKLFVFDLCQSCNVNVAIDQEMSNEMKEKWKLE